MKSRVMYVYDVSFRATRPERPNLMTQTQARARGRTEEEATAAAVAKLSAAGWTLVERIACVRRHRVEA